MDAFWFCFFCCCYCGCVDIKHFSIRNARTTMKTFASAQYRTYSLSHIVLFWLLFYLLCVQSARHSKWFECDDDDVCCIDVFFSFVRYPPSQPIKCVAILNVQRFVFFSVSQFKCEKETKRERKRQTQRRNKVSEARVEPLSFVWLWEKWEWRSVARQAKRQKEESNPIRNMLLLPTFWSCCFINFALVPMLSCCNFFFLLRSHFQYSCWKITSLLTLSPHTHIVCASLHTFFVCICWQIPAAGSLLLLFLAGACSSSYYFPFSSFSLRWLWLWHWMRMEGGLPHLSHTAQHHCQCNAQ